MKYQYIRMEELKKKPKTSVYGVFSNSSGDYLGSIEWWNGWRQYCFLPKDETVFSTGCMLDIIDFINRLKEERKAINNG